MTQYLTSDSWSEQLFNYCEEHYNEFFSRYGFIGLLDTDLLLNKMPDASTKEIKEDYLLAMERIPVKDLEIKVLLRAALTDKIHDREIYMKGVDASYRYEGYDAFRAAKISAEDIQGN